MLILNIWNPSKTIQEEELINEIIHFEAYEAKFTVMSEGFSELPFKKATFSNLLNS